MVLWDQALGKPIADWFEFDLPQMHCLRQQWGTQQHASNGKEFEKEESGTPIKIHYDRAAMLATMIHRRLMENGICTRLVSTAVASDK